MNQAGWSSIMVATMLFALCSFADAQQPGKIFRIGFLDPTSAGRRGSRGNIPQELSKLGWIEGKNITIEYRFAEEKPERLSEFAAELVRLKVDLIVVSGVGRDGGEERDHYHPHRDGDRSGSRGCRFGCQSGATGRQYHRALNLNPELNTKATRDTQGRGTQSRPS